MTLYICKYCHLEKDESFFPRAKRYKNGILPRCTSCLSIYSKDYYIKNKKRIQNRQEEYRKNNDIYEISGKDYYERNKERLIEKSKEYYRNNLDYFKKYSDKYSKNYYEKNKDKILPNKKRYLSSPQGKLNDKLCKDKRRGRKNNVENTLTTEEIKFLLSFQEEKCACCGIDFNDKVRYTLDHIIPLTKGGGLTLENVQLLCKHCNCSKNDRIIQYRLDIIPKIPVYITEAMI